VTTPLARQKLAAVTGETADASALFSQGLAILRTMRHDFGQAAVVMALVASGAEKMLKLTVGLAAQDHGHPWPDKKYMRNTIGHLVASGDQAARAALRQGRKTMNGHLQQLAAAVDADTVLAAALAALQRYGESGRFYQLDLLAEQPQPVASPAQAWGDMVTKLFDTRADLPGLIGSAETYEAGRRQINEAVADGLQRWWELYWAAWRFGVIGGDAQGLAQELKLKEPGTV
jgi:hypothetical protein